MIKYLGSKRLLAPVLGEIAVASGAQTVVDLFTGTTRVAQEFKRRGLAVTATDLATYSGVLSDCFIATDATVIDPVELADALAGLNALPGVEGYVTETFCHRARYFRPENGRRIDAVRAGLEEYRGSALFPVLMTSLLLAADRVDSTTGVQMAYLKQWASRSYRSLELLAPTLLPGPGRTVVGDVLSTIDHLPPVDLMYLDPPYNQHRYFTNYHVWETLVRGDEPEHYGIACKRVDAREEHTRSRFNSRRTMREAFAEVISRARAQMLVVSYNDESWMSSGDLVAMLREAGHEEVRVLGYDTKRYVGAQIGVFNGAGQRVGQPGRLRNVEHVFVAGPASRVRAAARAADKIDSPRRVTTPRRSGTSRPHAPAGA